MVSTVSTFSTVISQANKHSWSCSLPIPHLASMCGCLPQPHSLPHHTKSASITTYPSNTCYVHHLWYMITPNITDLSTSGVVIVFWQLWDLLADIGDLSHLGSQFQVHHLPENNIFHSFLSNINEWLGIFSPYFKRLHLYL